MDASSKEVENNHHRVKHVIAVPVLLLQVVETYFASKVPNNTKK